MIDNVLIITHKEDYTADFLINKLNDRKLKYKRFNCEDLYQKSYSIDKSFNLNFEGEENFSAVWFRRTKLPIIENTKPEIQLYLAEEYDTFLKNVFSILNCKWLSNPFEVYKAENKLLQLREAKKLGFNIPDTIITNSRELLLKFFRKNKERVIIKPLSQSKIVEDNSISFLFSNILKEEHIVNIEEYDLTPCIYQELIEKEIELRITVVGNNVFAAATNSQENNNTKIDWRREDSKFYEFKIPADIEQLCLKLVNTLNLKFGAIDMIIDKKGNYIFLEINPNGQWAWIETQTALPISEAIINVLYSK